VLSVPDCRRLLGPHSSPADSELQAIRDQLYALAAVVVGVRLEHGRHLKEKRRSTACAVEPTEGVAAKPFSTALAMLDEWERERVEERAAILEYEANLDRDTAERKTVADWLAGQR